MYKNFLTGAIILAISVFFVGCSVPNPVEEDEETLYYDWKNSDSALDLNGDRKIDELDYEIYQIQNSSDYWKNSDSALDFNGDRKIDELDYEIYLMQNSYEYWKNSDTAEDFNGDRKINESDYVIFLSDYEIEQELTDFKGTYRISDYTYIGETDNAINGYIDFIELEDFLTQMIISVDNEGEITVNIPNNVLIALGESSSVFVEFANNMSLVRISQYIVALDSYVSVNDLDYNFSFYLNEIENGYSTSYIMGLFDDDPVITFNVIKDE